MILLPILASVLVVPEGQSFKCTPTHVYDGDGPVWCAEGPRIRIAGIAAREMDGTCNANQPCPSARADQARDALVTLLGTARGRAATGHILVTARPMTCLSRGNAVGVRTGAWCKLADGRDLSCSMLKTRTVLIWRRYWGTHSCD
nr:hypothetical protein [Novosphingobium resinovorum]